MNAGFPPSAPQVAVVVLNYRNFADTVACLRSLAAVPYPCLETIVVDNDSRNDSLARIRAELGWNPADCPTVEEAELVRAAALPGSRFFVQAARNRGYAAGNNLGLRLALARDCDYALVLNNDTEVRPDFLEPLVAHAEAHPELAGVGPKILNPAGRVESHCARRRPDLGFYIFSTGIGRKLWPGNPWRRRHFYEGEYAFDRPREVDVLSGSCMLLRRAALEQVGLFDEATFLYQEELILHEKFRARGWRQAIVPQSVIMHKGGQATLREMPAHIRKAARASLLYYLKQYRRYGWPTRLAIVGILSAPRRLFGRGRTQPAIPESGGRP
ncbi:MAG: glycosyltransferase family 2 protein [Spartobacteria bacterium]|nr:glycosyltransferase family 2 protein [Spartobacteria bacterium]